MGDFIAEMPGPQFLLLYGAVILSTLGFCWLRMRSADPTASMPLPPVPATPDPYEVAYLRGGENEVMRTTVISLTQRGYLHVTEKGGWFSSKEQQISQTQEHADLGHLSALELALFEHFSTSSTAAQTFQDRSLSSKVQQLCGPYEQELQAEQFLRSKEMEKSTRRIGAVGVVVIVGLGYYKLLVALTAGRTNVLFLILMSLGSLWVLYKLLHPRLTHRGRQYVKQLERAYERFKGSRAGSHGPDLILLVAVFGTAALAGTPLDYYQGIFQKQSSGFFFAGGGCGGGCGGGGGGGCGGCG